MALWFIFALMTAAAIFAVLWPLSRSRSAVVQGTDVEVYRDQLAEVERDRANGIVSDEEAEAARIEISRRLLAAADSAERAKFYSAGSGSRRAVALAALVLLPSGVAAFYLAVGSPALPGQPLAARTDRPAAVASIIQRVEAHLEANPSDGQGWQVLAPVYLRLGRFDDAVKAARNAVSFLGANADREATLGEALVMQANSVVTADAKSAFDRALKHDPGEPRASYYLGIAAEQDNRAVDAARIWRELLDRSPPGAAWAGVVREALTRVGAAPSPGPTAQDMAAAGQLSESERAEMVRGMVSRLAERLKADGSDAEGWMRLVRAYLVLGDRDSARAALSDARQALAPQPERLRAFDDAIKQLGIDG